VEANLANTFVVLFLVSMPAWFIIFLGTRRLPVPSLPRWREGILHVGWESTSWLNEEKNVDLKQVITALNELADLSALAGENKHKSGAYRRAAENLEETTVLDIATFDWESVPGIGASIGTKVRQLVATGKLEKLEQFRAEFGPMRALMALPGVGPATAKKLWASGVRTVQDARVATGKADERYPRDEAQAVATWVVSKLSGEAVVCGSLRRGKETIGDVDIVLRTESLAGVETLFDAVLLAGEEKVSGLKDGLQVDVRRCSDPEEFGSMVLHFTGSKEFNIACRKLAQELGLKLNEYGAWRGEVRVAGRTELEVLELLGIGWVEPNERDGKIVELRLRERVSTTTLVGETT
jgi:DNA polymerase (family 10)